MTIQLGDEVKDTITGFKGIAVCRHTYIQGCDRISVLQKSTKDTPVPAEMSFDEPQLVVTKAVKPPAKPADRTNGGPERHMPQAKH